MTLSSERTTSDPSMIAPDQGAHRWLAVLCLLVPSLLLLFWLLGWIDHGFEASDEGYYLNSIANPHLYGVTTTQFGFFYHYLYWPITDNVAALRAANFLITLILGTVFGVVIFLADKRRTDWPLVIAAAAALSFSTLLVLANWLVSPNYNTLNLQGLLIAAIALLIIGKRPAPPSLAAIGLLALGGWITFLAKPSSAAFLGFVAMAYLGATRQARLKTVTLAFAFALVLLLVTAIVIDGSPSAFSRRLIHAATLPAALDPGYTLNNLFRFAWPSMPGNQWTLLFASAGVIALGILVCAQSSKLLYAALPLCALIGLLPLLALTKQSALPAQWQVTYALQILSVPVGIGVVILLRGLLRQAKLPTREAMANAALLWLLPYVFAFGSNNDYWYLAAFAGIFWIGSALILLKSVQRESWTLFQAVPIGLSSLAISGTVLLIGMTNPYRQTQSILLTETKTPIREERTNLILSHDYATYFTGLQRAARNAGFRLGDPMIDLTGHYPGALYALGAKAVGMPWIVGGYPGSTDVAGIAFSLVPCATLAKAWLLTEPGGPRALSTEVIGNYGQRYETVAEIESLLGEISQPLTQKLLKPIHDGAVVEHACATSNRRKIF